MRETCEMLAAFVEITEHDDGMREECTIVETPVTVEVEREVGKRVRFGAITRQDALIPDNADRIDLFSLDESGELVWVHSYCPRVEYRRATSGR